MNDEGRWPGDRSSLDDGPIGRAVIRRATRTRLRLLQVSPALLAFALVQAGVQDVVGAGPRVNRKVQQAQQLQRGAEGPRAAVSTAPSPAIVQNFEVVGHVELGGRAGDADVSYFDHGAGVGQFAYVGTWQDVCTRRGVKIVNVSDPAHPQLVAVARLNLPHVSYEDPVVMRIGQQVVLAVGVQLCGRGRRGGLGLFDVTNPAAPTILKFFRTVGLGVHELDVTTLVNGRVAALLAVPFGEDSRGKDFNIVDITDPRNPQFVAGWGAIKDSTLPIPNVTDPPTPTSQITTCCQGKGVAFTDFFFHSARAADAGRTAYVSHWDLGVLKFDLSDPANPKLVGRTTYPFDGEGEAHSLTVYQSGGVRYILQNDEDFEATSPAHLTTSATGTKTWAVLEEPWAPTSLQDTGPLDRKVHDAGRGCQRSNYVGAKGKIVLANVLDPAFGQGRCGLGRRILLAAASDAAALVFNLLGPNRPPAWYEPGPRVMKRIQRRAKGMPILGIASIDGLARAIRQAPVSVRMTLRAGIPEFGFLRIFSEAQASDQDADGILEFRQVGEFAGLPHVRGEADPPPGDWSIHNTEVWGNRAFSSWYGHGIVALDLTDPTHPALVGQFAPSGAEGRASPLLPKSAPAMWGVALDPARGLIYGSDIRSGLWILRPSGPARPTLP
jgi:hypothetical protein